MPNNPSEDYWNIIKGDNQKIGYPVSTEPSVISSVLPFPPLHVERDSFMIVSEVNAPLHDADASFKLVHGYHTGNLMEMENAEEISGFTCYSTQETESRVQGVLQSTRVLDAPIEPLTITGFLKFIVGYTYPKMHRMNLISVISYSLRNMLIVSLIAYTFRIILFHNSLVLPKKGANDPWMLSDTFITLQNQKARFPGNSNNWNRDLSDSRNPHERNTLYEPTLRNEFSSNGSISNYMRFTMKPSNIGRSDISIGFPHFSRFRKDMDSSFHPDVKPTPTYTENNTMKRTGRLSNSQPTLPGNPSELWNPFDEHYKYFTHQKFDPRVNQSSNKERYHFAPNRINDSEVNRKISAFYEKLSNLHDSKILQRKVLNDDFIRHVRLSNPTEIPKQDHNLKTGRVPLESGHSSTTDDYVVADSKLLDSKREEGHHQIQQEIPTQRLPWTAKSTGEKEREQYDTRYIHSNGYSPADKKKCLFVPPYNFPINKDRYTRNYSQSRIQSSPKESSESFYGASSRYRPMFSLNGSMNMTGFIGHSIKEFTLPRSTNNLETDEAQMTSALKVKGRNDTTTWKLQPQ